MAFVFYSSFFRYPGGLLESVRAFDIYVGRGIGPGPHTQPFDYYVRLLTYSSSGGLVWSEGVVSRWPWSAHGGLGEDVCRILAPLRRASTR